MAPGETGELFRELSGKEGEPKPPHRVVHYNADGTIAHIENAGMDPYPENLAAAADFAGFVQAGFEHGNPLPVTMSCSSGISQWYCASCQRLISLGDTHVCENGETNTYGLPDDFTFDPNPLGYTCIFCGAWISYGIVHTCLYDDSRRHDLVVEINENVKKLLAGQKEIKDGIHYLLQEIRKVQNG